MLMVLAAILRLGGVRANLIIRVHLLKAAARDDIVFLVLLGLLLRLAGTLERLTHARLKRDLVGLIFIFYRVQPEIITLRLLFLRLAFIIFRVVLVIINLLLLGAFVSFLSRLRGFVALYLHGV
jgi:hypothetical protein